MLSEERVAASQSADRAREAQMKLAEAVRMYVTQGIPIPFAMECKWTRTVRLYGSHGSSVFVPELLSSTHVNVQC